MKTFGNKVGNIIDTEAIAERGFNPKETYQLLKTSWPIMMSWGARDFAFDGDKYLRFKVNGYLLKGFVYVTLNFADLYKVYFTNGRHEIVEIADDVFFEDLSSTIDKAVETKDDYATQAGL